MTTPITLNLAPGSDTGVSHTDGITSDTSPVLTGTASPFATVALSDADSTLALTTRADKNGNFLFAIPDLATGVHVLTATTSVGATVTATSAPLDLDVETDATATSTPPANLPSTATSVVFNLHFDQPVSTLSPTSFVLATTGTAFGNVTAVSGSGEDYTVTATGLGGEGTVALAFSARGPTDLAGNQVALTTSNSQTVSDTTSPTTTIVSSDGFGVQGTGASPAISGGGRVVAFISDDGQLTPAVQTQAGIGNVFVKDTQTGAIALVTNGDDQTYRVQTSLDGTVVAFSSSATDLVPGGTPAGEINLYVARLTAANTAGGLSFVPGSITLVGTLDADPVDEFGPRGFALSGDGSTLAFGADSELPGGAGAGGADYFYNVATGAYTAIPEPLTASAGVTDVDDEITSISRNGTVVAYTGEVAVPGSGGQPDPYYGGNYGPDYVQDALVYNRTTGSTTTIDGTGLFGTVAPTAGGAVPTYLTADPQLSGDGKTVVFEFEHGNLSSLFSVGLANPAVLTPVSPGAGTEDGAGDYAYDPSVSSGGGAIAFSEEPPGGTLETELYTTVSKTSVPLGSAFDPVLDTQGNAVALAYELDSSGDNNVTAEVSLGTSVSIAPIDGNDAVDEIDLQAAQANGLQVSGTSNAPAGSPVVLEVNPANTSNYSEPITTAVGDDGTWTATLPEDLFDPTFLTDGYYFLNAQVAGPTGNSALVSRLFQVDTVAPAAPSTPTLDQGSNSGHDGIDTNTATPTLDGLAEPGATVLLLDASAGGAQLATATVDENGIYTLTSKPLADGAHTLEVEALDEAGNLSPASGTQTIKVDTVAPDAPSAPELASGNGATNDSTPTLTGTAEPNAFVTLYINNGSLALGTARAGSDGSYGVTSSKLADGDYTIAARATDAAGNVSPLSDGTPLEIDTHAPAAPAISAINGQVQPDGSLAPSFDVTGVAGAQTAVTLQVDGVTVDADTAQTRASGFYDISVPDLGPGTHTVDVIATDSAGNVSQASATQQVTITGAPAAPPGAPPGATLVQGTLKDGPILGATVFADANGDGAPDAGEASAVTDADGDFALYNPSGDLEATGGTDTTTGLTLPGPLFAPAGSTVIDPLTTLLYAYQIDTGAGVAAANAAVTAALGLGAATDLTTLDPYAAATAGSPALDSSVRKGAAEVAAAQLVDLATDVAAAFKAVGGASHVFESVFQTVAGQIAALPAGTTLDLTDPVTLLSLVGDSVALAGLITPDPTVAAATEQIVVAGNAQLASDLRTLSGQSLLTAVAGVEGVDGGTAATALGQIGADPGLAATLVPQFTGNPLVAAVNAGTSLIFGAPHLAAASDAGVSDQDNATDVDAPTFQGLAVPGTFVTLVQEEGVSAGQVLGTGQADAFGHYSIASTTITVTGGITPQFIALGSTADPGLTVGETVSLPAGAQPQAVRFDQPANAGPYGPTGAFIYGSAPVYSAANDANDSAVLLELSATQYGTVQVFADGGTTPVASGPVLSTGGIFELATTPLSFGRHTLTVVQSLPGGEALAGSSHTVTVAAPTSVAGTARGVGALAGGTVTQGSPSDGDTRLVPASVTDGNGAYQATYDPRQTSSALTLTGGYDTATGIPLGGYLAGSVELGNGDSYGTLTAPLGSAAITPFTSLVADLGGDLGGGLGQGEGVGEEGDEGGGTAALVLAALGLPPTFDLSTLDPLAEAEAGDPAPLIAAVKLLDTSAILNAVDTASNLLPFADAIAAGRLDLDDPASLAAAVEPFAPSDEPAAVVEAVAALAAAGNADLDAHAAASDSLADIISYAFAAERVAQEEVPEALRQAGLGLDTVTADTLAPVTSAFTGAALDAAVEAARGDTTQATSFVPDGPASTDASGVTFRITFSQAVTGLTTASFVPDEGAGLQGAAVTGVVPVAGSAGTQYDVSVATGAGAGTLALTYGGDGVTTAASEPVTSGTLAPPVTYLPVANIGEGSEVAAGDLNGDGRPDAVVLSDGYGVEVTPFLDDGSGQFTAGPPISTDAGGDYPVSPTVADVTGDGKADLVLAEYDPDVASGYGIPTYGDAITVLPGNGDGTFGTPINTPIGFVPGRLVTGDFNGDGHLDVAITDPGGNEVHIFLGTGSGGFTPDGTYAVGANPLDLAASDLNGDGKLDLVVSNRNSDTVSVLLGNGDGTFTPASTPAVAAGTYPTSIAVADLNGDGIPDLVVTDPAENGSDPSDPSSDAIAVLLGQGNGTFAAPSFFSFSSYVDLLSSFRPNTVVVGDMNDDGIPDLVAQGQGGETAVLLGNGDGTFRLWQLTNVGGGAAGFGASTLALADVDGDGRLDVLAPGGDNAPGHALNFGLDVLANEAQPVVGSTSAAVTLTRAALAQPVLTTASGTLTQSGSSYTLDLGQLAQGSSAPALQFALANAATSGSDSFDGTFAAPAGDGFTVTGADLPAALDPGQSYAGLAFAVDTSTAGAHTLTLTFAPRDETDDPGATATAGPGAIDGDNTPATLPPADAGGDDVSQELAPITLTVTDDVEAGTGVLPAVLGLGAASLALPDVRVGATDTAPLPVSNTAATGAAGLDVTATASGDATASGRVSALAPGATDGTDLVAGLATATAGAQTGTVTLDPVSDAAGVQTPLPAQTVDVSGAVFRPAAAGTIAPVSEVVHVGDSGTFHLTVDNTDPADGFSENLLAEVTAAPPGVTPSAGATPEIAPGASDTSLTLTVDTARAAVLSGTTTVALTTDGGTGAGSIDGLDKLALASQSVPVSVTVDNYAAPVLSATVNGAAATISDGVLNLGTLQLGSTPALIALTESNAAAGPADLLAASLASPGAAGFTNALGAVSGLGAGQSGSTGTVTLSTGTAGTFTETVSTTATGSDASGYSGAVSAGTLTITGTVAAPGTNAAPPAPPTIALVSPADGSLAPEAITDTPTPTVAGSTGASAAVSVLAAAATLGTTVADPASGAYTDTLATALPPGLSTLSASATNGAGTTPGTGTASAYTLPTPVAGVSMVDLASIDLGRLLDGGFVFQLTPGTEAVDLGDGVLSVGPDTDPAYVQRLYEGLFGRGDDIGGMSHWIGVLAAGGSKGDVAAGFLNAPEFLADYGTASAMAPGQFIGTLYQGILGRAPTAGDLSFWSGALSQYGQAAVLQGIADSPEAKAHNAAATAQVWAPTVLGTLDQELYGTGLGREAEPAGNAYWQAVLPGLSTVQAAALFVATPEFQALHAAQDPATYVRSLFDAGLGRDPTAAEAQPLVAGMQAGTLTQAAVLLNVATTPGAAAYLTRNLNATSPGAAILQGTDVFTGASTTPAGYAFKG